MRWRGEKKISVDKEEKGEKRKEREERREGKRIEREREERETKEGDFPGIPTVEARWSEKKSRSKQLGLRLGTNILEFCQTP